MNMLAGVVRNNGAGSRVALASGGDIAAPGLPDDGREVLYGIRPEHLSLTDPSQGLAVDVVVVEPTGADTQVVCRIGGHDIIAVLRDRVSCRAGDRVGLKPDASRAHLFDASSGARLTA
jgi:multiple sugar transport system ATP-binding protein